MWALFFAPEWNASEAYTYINIVYPIRQIAASAGKTSCHREKTATFYLRSLKTCDRMRANRGNAPLFRAIFAKPARGIPETGNDRAVDRFSVGFREGALLRAPAANASAFPREPPTERALAQVGSDGSLRYRSECAVSAANCGWYRGS